MKRSWSDCSQTANWQYTYNGKTGSIAMKIAITAKDAGLEAEVDPRFGRAAHILIVDTDTMAFEALDNTDNINAFRGAGIQAASMVSDKGAQVLLTGYCGPKAFAVLQAAGVNVANDVTGTVADAVKAFKEGKFSYADQPNADGHW
jgi:predicted Fe-Mo cluster-binding NifX family protein